MAEKGYGRPELLVSTEWLSQHVDDPDLRIVDARGVGKYGAGHIRNAVNLPVARLEDPTHPVRGMLLPPERFGALLEGLGIGNENTVVIYDDSEYLQAARLFWALEHYGHRQVALLNGGYPKWSLEGREAVTDSPGRTAVNYVAKSDPTKLATKSEVLERLGKGQVALLDVRSPQEYTGEMVQALRGGHIPGAANIEWSQALAASNVPTFRSAQELSVLYRGAGITPEKEVITYCQSGVRSAHTYFVLRLLGYNNVRNYDGSWTEWGNDPALPIDQG